MKKLLSLVFASLFLLSVTPAFSAESVKTEVKEGVAKVKKAAKKAKKKVKKAVEVKK